MTAARDDGQTARARASLSEVLRAAVAAKFAHHIGLECADAERRLRDALAARDLVALRQALANAAEAVRWSWRRLETHGASGAQRHRSTAP